MNATQSFTLSQGVTSCDLSNRPALRRSFRRADRAKTLKDPTWGDTTATGQPRAELRVWNLPAETPHLGLEIATKSFRLLRAAELRREAADARRDLAKMRDAWGVLASSGVLPSVSYDAVAVSEGHTGVFRELAARARWYEQRAGAQLPRFDTVRACRTRIMHVACRTCDTSGCDPIACPCGVVRVCSECASAVAGKRQRRIAAARVTAILDGAHEGLFFRKRRGGAFSEKMLTLTVPHVSLEETSGDVRAACGGFQRDTTVNARLTALRLAWPKFMRRVRRWLKSNDPAGARAFKYYRLFEWTRGSDGLGHPHFHVYLFSPWLSVELCREWWAASLESVGCPLPVRCSLCPEDGSPCSRAHVVIDLRRLEGFNFNALRELVKSGDRRALETRMGELRGVSAPGLDAIKYAAAWSMGDAFGDLPAESRAAVIDVERDLYIAGEGRRFAQGARGFLAALPRMVCECCGSSSFVASVALPWETSDGAKPVLCTPREERGPPMGSVEP